MNSLRNKYLRFFRFNCLSASALILIPSVFSSSNLSFKTNSLLVSLTAFSVLFLTFYSKDLPSPLSDHFHVSPYYYFSIPIALLIALVFLNYFAMTFGSQSRLRKDALSKMEEVMAKEHELLSLGGQAAAAAHSLSLIHISEPTRPY